MPDGSRFPICDALSANPAKHCAALVITENVVPDQNGWPIPGQPSAELRNGTLTFVETGGRVYGIACWHVIEYFRKLLAASGNPYSHSMRTMVNGFYIVLDRFARPGPQFGDPPLDIAVRALDPDLVSTIGKIPIDLDSQPKAPHDIKHGLAVGFPETTKYKRLEDQSGYRISMPHAEIVAEIAGLPTHRFGLFSELGDMPSQIDYSGMSGGPIFWSTEESYGIFGIVYEGSGSGLAGSKSAYVRGEVATPEVIKGWMSQLPAQPALFPIRGASSD